MGFNRIRSVRKRRIHGNPNGCKPGPPGRSCIFGRYRYSGAGGNTGSSRRRYAVLETGRR
nr:MAG TPA: hypothetical protein [Caudoviricetes sp.]